MLSFQRAACIVILAESALAYDVTIDLPAYLLIRFIVATNGVLVLSRKFILILIVDVWDFECVVL